MKNFMGLGRLSEQFTTSDILLEDATMRVFASFYSAIVSDFRDTFPSYGSTEQHDDKRYLLRRLANEGSNLALVTLPSLGRALNAALGDGVFKTPTPAFRAVPGTVLPRLCHSLWRLVFTDDGRLHSDNLSQDEIKMQAIAVRALRQLTLAWSKVELNSDLNKINAAVKGFVDRTGTDPYLKMLDDYRDEEDLYQRTTDLDAWDEPSCRYMVNRGQGLNPLDRFARMCDNRRANLIRGASKALDEVFQAGKLRDRTFPRSRGTTCYKQGTSDAMVQGQSTNGCANKERNGTSCNM